MIPAKVAKAAVKTAAPVVHTAAAHFHSTGWGLYYVAWVLIGFLPYEIYWAIVCPNNTLSDQWRALEGVGPYPVHPFEFAAWTPMHWVMAVILLGFFVWLWGHLVFGIWG